MINFTITEKESDIDDRKAMLKDAFPGCDKDKAYKVLNDYDNAYLSAREYFAYYFVMTTETIIDYVNEQKMGRIWQFTTDAIFDEGINTLYQFYDKQSKEYRFVLQRAKDILGVPISTTNKNDEHIKMLKSYRNNHSAHFGDGFYKKETGITYDLPIILLERLRRDRHDFNKEHLDLTYLIYDELKTYFITKIQPVIQMLNKELDTKNIENELVDYLDGVITDDLETPSQPLY